MINSLVNLLCLIVFSLISPWVQTDVRIVERRGVPGVVSGSYPSPHLRLQDVDDCNGSAPSPTVRPPPGCGLRGRGCELPGTLPELRDTHFPSESVLGLSFYLRLLPARTVLEVYFHRLLDLSVRGPVTLVVSTRCRPSGVTGTRSSCFPP